MCTVSREEYTVNHLYGYHKTTKIHNIGIFHLLSGEYNAEPVRWQFIVYQIIQTTWNNLSDEIFIFRMILGSIFGQWSNNLSWFYCGLCGLIVALLNQIFSPCNVQWAHTFFYSLFHGYNNINLALMLSLLTASSFHQ